jgi:hypothetical protein
MGLERDFSSSWLSFFPMGMGMGWDGMCVFDDDVTVNGMKA